MGEPSNSQLVIHNRVQHHSSKSFGIPNYPPSALSPKFVGHTFTNKTMRIGQPAFKHTIELDSCASSPKSLKLEKCSDKNGLFSMLSKVGTTIQPIQRSSIFADMVTIKPWWKRGKK